MIRTRDFILFLLALLFLAIAITSTLVVEDSLYVTLPNIDFTDSYFIDGAVATTRIIDRESNLNRLRTKLANSTESIEPVASVAAPEDEENIDEDGVGLQKCLYPDDSLSMVPRWPLTNVKVAVKEGARLVFAEEISVVPAAASTTVDEEVVTTITPLLQLPLKTKKLAEAVCVPSEVVGVTSGGVLMFNGDINSYRKIPENALIGYARDGFPIYGVFKGEVDACGGYDTPTGYRYAISTERDYIIGCYVGAPQKFSL